ncbi:uncharacterized protein JNUCC1_03473 [Lentibacillus sp. JNUCC-1]|nr:uncharacterized protein [Lentibacillus sp. JNUCC-1]
MVSKKRKFRSVVMILLVVAIASIQFTTLVLADNSGSGKKVYVIPVKDEVERGLEAFLERATKEAKEASADHIIFEIDTPGGRVDAAGNIANILQKLDIPTTAFVINRALSAGSYIALYADEIYMTPQATMGASGIINQDGTAADKKAQSAWIAAMEGAAEAKERDPLYARAMADASVDLPEYDAPKGEFLTLTPSKAVEVEYAEGVVKHRTALLNELGLSGAEIHEVEQTTAEGIARFLTNPVVIPILLSVASLGLVVELYSPGFGVPGIMGLIALVLFFYGHIIAGLAGMESVILLILGIALIIAEFFVPGGIVGLLGVGAVLGALLMAGYDLGHMAMSVGIAFIVSVVAAVILFKTMGLNKGLFRHIVLQERTTTEEGYVSSVSRLELIGLEGVTQTPLRPAGTALFDDERLDVVSEGGLSNRIRRLKL